MQYATFTKGFHANIDDLTHRNTYFRQVLVTTPTLQVVLMSLEPGEEIGAEVHPYITQFIKVEEGWGTVRIGNQHFQVQPGVAVVIPPNTLHNVINNTSKVMKLYTIYAPPNHPSDKLDVEKTED